MIAVARETVSPAILATWFTQNSYYNSMGHHEYVRYMGYARINIYFGQA